MKQSRRAAERGFTLVEIMVVVVIIGLLSAIVIGRLAWQSDKARVTVTKAKIQEISEAAELFKLELGRYPENLEDMVSAPNWVDPKKWPKGGFLTEVPVDAWGNEFVYRRTGPESQEPFEVISYGADGREGGEEYDADLMNYKPRN